MVWVGKFNSLVSLLISIPYLITCYLNSDAWFMFAVVGYLWFLLASPLLSLVQITFIIHFIIKKDHGFLYQFKALFLVAIGYLIFYLGLQNGCYVTV
ncbi:MAG: hypothetical protein COA68_11305 [Oceanobacter sp.]|nr:MAG: hypothetical protein COA68_11305 [Oceanobacter sp.]